MENHPEHFIHRLLGPSFSFVDGFEPMILPAYWGTASLSPGAAMSNTETNQPQLRAEKPVQEINER
jgi:hypothetical protein